jgi:hypothetical protein
LISALAHLVGILYCFYCVCFRWDRIRRKYGLLDLYYWPAAVAWVFSFVGGLIDIALWLAFPPT